MSSTDPLPILYQDEFLCIVNKPAGMPSQPDPTGDPSVLDRLKEQLGSASIGLVHRLDRPVSGVMLFALDPETLRLMNDQFKQRAVQKTYHAIVEGRPEWKGTELRHSLKHDAKAKKSRAAEGGEEAILHARLLAQGDRFALIEVKPQGGAFHQIRAQLAAAGHPIKGDVKYGARRGEKDRSIALHARSLSFHHPATDKLVEVTAPHRSDGIWLPLIALSGIE